MGNFGIPVVGDLIGGIMQSNAQREANATMTDNANRQMDFQAAQNATAHQREVADLRAAGLNPILSANAGASSGSGAMAQAMPVDAMGKAVSNAAKDYQEYSQQQEAQDSNIKNQKADTDNKRATKNLIELQATATSSQAEKYNEEATQSKMQTEIMREGLEANKAAAKIQPYVDMAGQGVKIGAEVLGGGWAAKSLMDSILKNRSKNVDSVNGTPIHGPDKHGEVPMDYNFKKQDWIDHLRKQ